MAKYLNFMIKSSSHIELDDLGSNYHRIQTSKDLQRLASFKYCGVIGNNNCLSRE